MGQNTALLKPEGVPPVGGIKMPLVPSQVQYEGWRVCTPRYFTYYDPVHGQGKFSRGCGSIYDTTTTTDRRRRGYNAPAPPRHPRTPVPPGLPAAPAPAAPLGHPAALRPCPQPDTQSPLWNAFSDSQRPSAAAQRDPGLRRTCQNFEHVLLRCRSRQVFYNTPQPNTQVPFFAAENRRSIAPLPPQRQNLGQGTKPRHLEPTPAPTSRLLL